MNFFFLKTMRLKRSYELVTSDCPDRFQWLPASQKKKFEILWLIAVLANLKQTAYLFDLWSIGHTHQPLRTLDFGFQLHQPVSSSLFLSSFFLTMINI